MPISYNDCELCLEYLLESETAKAILHMVAVHHVTKSQAKKILKKWSN